MWRRALQTKCGGATYTHRNVPCRTTACSAYSGIAYWAYYCLIYILFFFFLVKVPKIFCNYVSLKNLNIIKKFLKLTLFLLLNLFIFLKNRCLNSPRNFLRRIFPYKSLPILPTMTLFPKIDAQREKALSFVFVLTSIDFFVAFQSWMRLSQSSILRSLRGIITYFLTNVEQNYTKKKHSYTSYGM